MAESNTIEVGGDVEAESNVLASGTHEIATDEGTIVVADGVVTQGTDSVPAGTDAADIEKVQPYGQEQFLEWYNERYRNRTMKEMADELGIKATSFGAKVSKLRGNLLKLDPPYRLGHAKRAERKRRKDTSKLAAKAAELNLERLTDV